MSQPAEGICRTCIHRFGCLERDRGIACTDYKGDKNDKSKMDSRAEDRGEHRDDR